MRSWTFTRGSSSSSTGQRGAPSNSPSGIRTCSRLTQSGTQGRGFAFRSSPVPSALAETHLGKGGQRCGGQDSRSPALVSVARGGQAASSAPRPRRRQEQDDEPVKGPKVT